MWAQALSSCIHQLDLQRAQLYIQNSIKCSGEWNYKPCFCIYRTEQSIWREKFDIPETIKNSVKFRVHSLSKKSQCLNHVAVLSPFSRILCGNNITMFRNNSHPTIEILFPESLSVATLLPLRTRIY